MSRASFSATGPSVHTVPLRALAKVVRSKNSGPFEITFDVMFEHRALFEHVRDSGALTAEGLARLYGVVPSDVIVCMFFEPALAFKLTLRRTWGQGTVGERDTFGAQQHVPLMEVPVPALPADGLPSALTRLLHTANPTAATTPA